MRRQIIKGNKNVSTQTIKENDLFILEEVKGANDTCEICSKKEETLYYLYGKDGSYETINIIMCNECREKLKEILL